MNKITEKDLTLIKSDDSWDSPEIKKVGDIVHKLRLSKYHRRHDVEFYLRLIKQAAKEGDKEKMLSVLLHDMLVRDRVMPSRQLINILLLNLANLGGHSEAALRILKRIKDIRLEPNMVTYSLVFKNCAREIGGNDLYFNLCNKGINLLNEDELEQIQSPAKKAFNVWKAMIDDNNLLNLSATNSLLLTLNRAGMLKESCIVLDRFIAEGNRVDDYTLSAMLEGCLCDRVNGFGLALTFYNKLVNHHRCSLSPFAITTLLKVVEKCQFGNLSLIHSILNSSSVPSSPSPPSSLSSSPQPLLIDLYQHCYPSSSNNNNDDNIFTNSSIIHCCTQHYNSVIKDTSKTYNIDLDTFIDSSWSPSNISLYVLKSPTNMLQKKFYNYLDLKWLQSSLSPSDKLVCIGGIFGLINLMKQYSVKPNIYTLTSLIKCLPYNKTDYQSSDLFTMVVEKVAEQLQLNKDQAFKNAILKRKITLGIKVTEEPINSSNHDPYTWSVEAKRCKTSQDVRDFFTIVADNNIVVNKEMLFSLFTSVYTWGARLSVLHKMKKMKIVPDRGMIVFMEAEISKMRERIKGMDDEENSKRIKELFYIFQKEYALWLDNVNIDTITAGQRKILIDDLPDEYKRK